MSDKKKNPPYAAPGIESGKVASKVGLTVGMVYQGKIVESTLDTGLCSVKLSYPDLLLQNCVWAVGAIMAPLLGFKTKTVPPVGGEVLVVYGKPSYIIQVLGAERNSPAGASRSATGDHTRDALESIYGGTGYFNGLLNTDVLEGEFDISNALGVGLLFLNSLMVMKAGDRARVETHLNRDLLRLISENFEQFTPLGMDRISSGVNASREEIYASHPEWMENFLEGQRNLEVQADRTMDSVGPDELVYRDQYRKYTGWVSDFVHEFVKDPATSAASIFTGKSLFHRGSDGLLLLQSVNEIVLERVCRVTVPQRLKEDFDPKGDREEDILEGLPPEPLKVWNYETPQEAAYQLREYARYLNSFKSLARFRQLKKDFKVSKESETPSPRFHSFEKDKMEEETQDVRHIDTYSTIRLMRDGSIVILDGYGSAVYMGRGVVQISSPGDLFLEAGGNIVGVAAGFFVRSKNSIEMVSSSGEVNLFGEDGVRLMGQNGPVHIKSNRIANTEDANHPHEQGIVLDAPMAGVSVLANGGLNLESETDVISLVGRNGISFVSPAGVISSSARSFFTQCRENYVVAGGRAYFKMSNMLFGNRFQISGGGVTINSQLSVSAPSSFFGGIKSVNVGPQDAPNTDIRVGPHFGHVGLLQDEDEFVPPDTEDVENVWSDHLGVRIFRYASTEISSVIYSFDDASHTFTSSYTGELLYRPHAQDFLFAQGGVDYPNHEEWDLGSPVITPGGIRTLSSSYPWPGSPFKEELFHPPSAGEDLRKPSNKDTWAQTALQSGRIKRKVRKPN